MKGIKPTAALIVTALLLSGCSMNLIHNKALDLPSNPQSYKQVYQEDDGETSIEIGGRTYSYFGGIRERMSDDSIRECLGYVDNDKNTRIYSLNDDPLDNYIMIRHIGGIMDQPVFLRAKDTVHEDIYTPSYIKSSSYESWGSSGVHYDMSSVNISLICNAENVREIGYEFLINGESAGIGGVRYASANEIRKGELFDIEITEIQIDGKADRNKTFTISLIFNITDTDGQIKNVEGTYGRDVMLGASLNGPEIRYDDTNGYYLFEDV